MTKDLLTSLPSHLSGLFLSTWLSLISVGRLDSAYCNHKLRPSLLAILQSIEFVHSNQHHIEGLIFLQWLGKRYVHVLNIVLDFRMDVETVSRYVKQCGRFLQTLELSNAVPADLAIVSAGCRQLKYYTHSNAHFNRAFTTVLQRNKNLQEIRLNQLTFNSSFVMPEMMLPLLTLVSMRNCWCNSNILTNIVCSSANLLKLDLHNSKGITDYAITRIASHCSRLISLGLGRVHLLNSTIVEICILCPNIQHLDLFGNSSLRDETMLGIVQHLTYLRSINLQGCESLTNAALSHLSMRKTTLEVIYVDLGGRLHENNFFSLIRQCPKLTSCGVSAYFNETVQLSSSLSFESLSHLTTLSIRTVWVQDETLLNIARHCTKLQLLDLRHTTYSFLRGYEPSFTRVGLLTVVQNCPDLLTLVIVPSFYYDPSVDLAEFKSLRPNLSICADHALCVYDVLRY